VLRVEVILMFEQPVMHLPELSLGCRCFGGLSGCQCVGVH